MRTVLVLVVLALSIPAGVTAEPVALAMVPADLASMIPCSAGWRIDVVAVPETVAYRVIGAETGCGGYQHAITGSLAAQPDGLLVGMLTVTRYRYGFVGARPVPVEAVPESIIVALRVVERIGWWRDNHGRTGTLQPFRD